MINLFTAIVHIAIHVCQRISFDGGGRSWLHLLPIFATSSPNPLSIHRTIRNLNCQTLNKRVTGLMTDRCSQKGMVPYGYSNCYDGFLCLSRHHRLRLSYPQVDNKEMI